MGSVAPTASETSIDAADRSAAVLTKAFLRAGQELGLSGRDLASVLGSSEATISRMRRGHNKQLARGTKPRELAMLFIRAFRGLDAIVGGNTAHARAWFHAHNRHLGERPIELVRSVEGITNVVRYLDAMRSRV